MGYESFLIKEGKNKGISRDEVIAELDDLAQSAAPMDSFKQWNEWIELYEDELKNAVSDREKDGVNLITMHSSKGLEYRMVILPDLLEGVIPQKKADKQDELEEERRVFYVAVTRAKEKLVLCTLKKDTEKRIKPSRFLKELL
jgi:DNA helicase-2/ATP-dependent DNA helicase PcrA